MNEVRIIDKFWLQCWVFFLCFLKDFFEEDLKVEKLEILFRISYMIVDYPKDGNRKESISEIWTNGAQPLL